ncbi:DUF4340 domain-containing protein [Isosphaeraceae bacterium EP7]
MKNRSTALLLVLFFGGLLGLWVAQYWRVPTSLDRAGLSGRVLPELVELRQGDLRRLEINGGETSIMARREPSGHWRLMNPVDTLADDALVENLAYNLKVLRVVPDAGTVDGSPESYGFGSRPKTIRLYGSDSARPLATIELGDVVRGNRYVRVPGEPGIHVVDAAALALADIPDWRWRESRPLAMPAHEVDGLTVKGEGLDVALKRDGKVWRIVRPYPAPADTKKVEALLAQVTGLAVADGRAGYVADDVKDLHAYGLDKPTLTVEVHGPRATQTLEIGGEAPADSVDARRLFAHRPGQDDVVKIDPGPLLDLGKRLAELRIRKLAAVEPGQVTRIEYQSPRSSVVLFASGSGGMTSQPAFGGEQDGQRFDVDQAGAAALLKALNEAVISESLAPEQAAEAGVDPPSSTLRLWWAPANAGRSGSPPSTAKAGSISPDPGRPADLTLALGRRDRLKKVIFARVEGDPATLAVQESLADALPSEPWPFRNRTLAAVGDKPVWSLTVKTGDGTTRLRRPPGSPAGLDGRGWEVILPGRAVAAADADSVAAVLRMLSTLRAERFVAGTDASPTPYGLDRPLAEVSWQASSTPDSADSEARSLKIGREVGGGSKDRYAILGGSGVFTVDPVVGAILNIEFRDRRVLAFNPARIRRIVLGWPDRTVALERKPGPLGSAGAWQIASGFDGSGFDPTPIPELLETLKELRTTKFVHQNGPFPGKLGLTPPLLTLSLESDDGPKVLRVGAPDLVGSFYATTDAGAEGAAFLLSGNVIGGLLFPPTRPEDLPLDPFMPDAPVAPR